MVNSPSLHMESRRFLPSGKAGVQRGGCSPGVHRADGGPGKMLPAADPAGKGDL